MKSNIVVNNAMEEVYTSHCIYELHFQWINRFKMDRTRKMQFVFLSGPGTLQLLCSPAGANRVLTVLVGGTCILSMAHHPLTGQLLQQDGCGGV